MPSIQGIPQIGKDSKMVPLRLWWREHESFSFQKNSENIPSHPHSAAESRSLRKTVPFFF